MNATSIFKCTVYKLHEQYHFFVDFLKFNLIHGDYYLEEEDKQPYINIKISNQKKNERKKTIKTHNMQLWQIEWGAINFGAVCGRTIFLQFKQQQQQRFPDAFQFDFCVNVISPM